MASFQLGDRPPEYHASLTAGFAFGYARQSGVTVDLNGGHFQKLTNNLNSMISGTGIAFIPCHG